VYTIYCYKYMWSWLSKRKRRVPAALS
jgi:hypothetical protein